MSPSLETTIAGIRLETCIYNASGPRTGSSAALSKIAASSAGGVLAKSATVQKQTGNPLPRTWHDEPSDGSKSAASLNSEGLPNSGIDYYIDEKTIKESMGDTGKPYMVSISGATLKDNIEMLKTILGVAKQNNIAAIELNLACPNVIGKPIIAYDFAQMDDVLTQVSKIKGITDIPLGVKMPPYFDGPHFQQAAQVLNKHKNFVRYAASINTIGNALSIDPVSEAPAISAKGGFAGLSGRAIKYTALANVRQMRNLLDESIDVIGVGGISSGTDAFEMLLCGAKAVQIGTCHWNEGPKCFDRICDELRELMEEKGYTSVEKDVIGQLKEFSKEGASKSRQAKKARESLRLEKQGSVQKRRSTVIGMLSPLPEDFSHKDEVIFLLLVTIGILLANQFGLV